MEFILSIPNYVLPFLVVLSVLVFVHEFGHYFMARFFNVRVSIFSIGFGPEVFGFNDKKGTRWKFSLIPLGGFVQMFGDTDPASTADDENAEEIPENERKFAFYYKNVWQRMAIVFAGPAINFIYAVVVMAGLFIIQGQPYAPPMVGGVVEGGAADLAGFEPDDRIVSVNGQDIVRFQDLKRIVSVNLDRPLEMVVDRNGEIIQISVKPEIVDEEDSVGFVHQAGRLGIMSAGKIEIEEYSFVGAMKASVVETWSITTSTLDAIGQIFTGERSTEELGGVVRIGAYAKEFSDAGIASLIMFSAIISINLGLINLFPIPLLDGGHILFYLYEAVRGKKLPAKAQQIGYAIGYSFVIVLMLYSTWNDLVQLNFINYLLNLAS